MFGLPAAASRLGYQSRPEKIPFSTVPGLTWPGQRQIVGKETAFKNGAFRGSERRHCTIRPSKRLGTVVSGEDDDSVVGDPHVIQRLQERTHRVIELRHTGLLEAKVGVRVHHGLLFR